MCHTKKSVLVESLFLLLATQSRPRSCGHVSMEIRIYLFGEQLTSRRKQEPQYEVSRILTILTTVRCRYNTIYSLHNWLPWYSFCIKTVRLKKSAAPIKRNAINAIEYKLNSKPALRWRHTGCDSVSNQQPHHCLLNRLFRRRSKKHQSSASLAFVWGIHRGPVNSPHKWPVTRQMFPFDDVIMDHGDTYTFSLMSTIQRPVPLWEISKPSKPIIIMRSKCVTPSCRQVAWQMFALDEK